MSRIFSLIIGIILIGMVGGCKDKEPEGENKYVWAYSKLVYDANSDQTYARTTFRYGGMNGAFIQLVPGASITFNGSPLNWVNSTSSYQKQYDGLIESGTFAYTDGDGNVYSNTISVPSSIGFPADMDSLSVSEDYELNWTGSDLQANERVELTLSAKNTNGEVQEFVAEGDGEFGLFLTAEKLDNLGTGTTNMQMEKIYVPSDFTIPPAGGLLESRYQAVPNLNVAVTQ